MLFRNTPYLVPLVVAIFQSLPGRAWVPRNEVSLHVTILETGKSHGRDSFRESDGRKSKKEANIRSVKRS